MSEKKRTAKKERLPKVLNLEGSRGVFVDGYGIGASETKEVISLSFMTLILEEAYVFSRVVLSKTVAKSIADSINEILGKMK